MKQTLIGLSAACALAATAHAYTIAPNAADGQEIRYEHGQAMIVSRKPGSVVRVLPHENGPHGRLVFTVVAYNQGVANFNFGYENVTVSNDLGPVRLFTLNDMRREALKSARWRAFAVALAASAQTYSASQTSSYSSSGSVCGSGGYANFSSSGRSYNPALTSIAVGQIQGQASNDMQAISSNLDAYVGAISHQILAITTVDPGTASGGAVFADKPKFAKADDHIVKVVVRAGADTHEFSFTVPNNTLSLVTRRHEAGQPRALL